MIVSAITPRPTALPTLPSVEMTAVSTPVFGLPSALRETINVDVDSTRLQEEQAEGENYYLAPSHYDAPWRMKSAGFADAMAAATTLLKSGLYADSVAVVQDPKDGARYVVPFGMWNPADESELGVGDIGGVHFTSADDYTLLQSEAGGTVEAVVLDGGRNWVNFTGHPVQLPAR